MNDETQDAMLARVRQAIAQAGGWLPFDRYMSLVLYTPNLGYYANQRRKFGTMPQSGSDFVTAPELSPLFGRALAAQVAAVGAAVVRRIGVDHFHPVTRARHADRLGADQAGDEGVEAHGWLAPGQAVTVPVAV